MSQILKSTLPIVEVEARNTYGREYMVAVIGPARTGKSSLISSFIQPEFKVASAIASIGIDKTKALTTFTLIRKPENILEVNKDSFYIILESTGSTPEIEEFLKDTNNKLKDLDIKESLVLANQLCFEAQSSNKTVKFTISVTAYMSDLAESVIPENVKKLIVSDTEGAGLKNNPFIPEKADHYLVTVPNMNLDVAVESFKKLVPYLGAGNVTYLYNSPRVPSKAKEVELITADVQVAVKQFEDMVLSQLEHGDLMKDYNLFNTKPKTIPYYLLPFPSEDEPTTSELIAEGHVAYSNFQEKLKLQMADKADAITLIDEAADLSLAEKAELLSMFKIAFNLEFTRTAPYTKEELLAKLDSNNMGRTPSYDGNEMQKAVENVRKEFIPLAYAKGLEILKDNRDNKLADLFAKVYLSLINSDYVAITGGWHTDTYPRYCQEGYTFLFGPLSKEITTIPDFLGNRCKVYSKSWEHVFIRKHSLLASETHSATHLYYTDDKTLKPELPNDLKEVLKLVIYQLPIYSLVELRLKS